MRHFFYIKNTVLFPLDYTKQVRFTFIHIASINISIYKYILIPLLKSLQIGLKKAYKLLKVSIVISKNYF